MQSASQDNLPNNQTADKNKQKHNNNSNNNVYSILSAQHQYMCVSLIDDGC